MTTAADAYIRFVKKDSLPFLFAYHVKGIRDIYENNIYLSLKNHYSYAKGKPMFFHIKFLDYLNSCIDYNLYYCCSSFEKPICFENARTFFMTYVVSKRVAGNCLADFKAALRLYTIELLFLTAYFNRLLSQVRDDINSSRGATDTNSHDQGLQCVFEIDLPSLLYDLCFSNTEFGTLQFVPVKQILADTYWAFDKEISNKYPELFSIEEAMGLIAYQLKFDYNLNPLAEICQLYDNSRFCSFNERFRLLFLAFRCVSSEDYTFFPY